MTNLNWLNKLMLTLLSIAVLIWIMGVADPLGSEIFIQRILGSLLFLFVIFSLSKAKQKIPSYIFFLFPLIFILSALFFFLFHPLKSKSTDSLNLTLISSGILTCAILFLLSKELARQIANDLLSYFKEHWVTLFFAPLTAIGLQVVSIFTPQTIDSLLEKIDFFIFRTSIDAWVQSTIKGDFLISWFTFFYTLLPLYPLLLSSWFFFKDQKILMRKVLQSFVLAGVIGWIFYVIFPAVGPLYIDLKTSGFPDPEIPRNCFPSLHTTWGLLPLIYAFKHNRKAFWILFFPVSQMIMATVTLRFHYVIDLIASIPFTYFIFWLNEKLLLLEEKIRNRQKVIENEVRPATRRTVYSVFVLSGASALIFQVYLIKKTSLIFGSTAIAVSTVLAVYMLGLAIGNYFGGKIADRVKSPLKFYALAEIIAAILIIFAPQLFKWQQALYISIASGQELGLTRLTFLRFALSLPIILLPTLAMGTTMPFLTRFLTRSLNFVTHTISRLYSANIAGAALGTFLATYLLIPNLGLLTSLSIAVIINLSVALICLQLEKNLQKKVLPPVIQPETEEIKPEKLQFLLKPASINTLLIIAALLLGFYSFAAEVIWTHLLAMVIGNSVYAFNIMLISVLLGLAIGGYIAGILNLRPEKKMVISGILQLVSALTILLQLFLWDKIPMLFENMWVSAPHFAQREFVRFVVSFLMLILPTLITGITFPLLASIYSANLQFLGSRIGRFSSFNTLGNIFGSLAAGFLFLPLLGSFNSSKVLAGLTFLLGIILISITAIKKKLLVLIASSLIFILSLTAIPFWNLTRLSLGTNVYFMRQHNGEVIDYWEEKDGGFTTVTREEIANDEKKRETKLTLWTNGKFQGDNIYEMGAQLRIALYPILFCHSRHRALVIGLGTGVSGRMVHACRFPEVDIAEISPGIVAAARKYFSQENGNLLDQPEVTLMINDGRNVLLLNQKPYDLITMEVSSVWFAGASALYSTEFYELAKKNLKPDGILQQWIQLHRISEYDILVTLASVRQVFPHVRLFWGGNQGVIIASQKPLQIPFESLIRFEEDHPHDLVSRVLPFDTIFSLLGEELLGEKELNRLLNTYLQRFQVSLDKLASNDDNLFLEYSTPRGNVNDYSFSLFKNLQFLYQFSSPASDVVTEIPDSSWADFVSGAILLGKKLYSQGILKLETARAGLPAKYQARVDQLIASAQKLINNQVRQP